MSIVAQKPVIYQLVVRYFGNTNITNRWAAEIGVNGCGKFCDVNDAAIRALVDFGVTHVWLTGCLRQATLTAYPDLPADDPDIVKGRAGSFYAVRDYFDVCPDYANDPKRRMDEFEALIERLHAAELKVLIDFVPNHVARSYGSVIKPEFDFGAGDDQTKFFDPQNCFFYLVDPPGQTLLLPRPPYWQPAGVQFDGRFEPENGERGHTVKATADASKDNTTANPSLFAWYEAIKLNYGFNYADQTTHVNPIPRTWLIMDQVLAYWQSKGVDGFRCDMAHLIPKEAWAYLISRTRDPGRDPACYFLAEAYVGSPYEPIHEVSELLDAGFNTVYHDNSYDKLKRIYEGLGSLDDYDSEMKGLSEREWSAAVEYLENHDKPRVAAPIAYGGFGSAAANYQLAPLQFLYSNGPVLILNAQEVGEPGAGFEGFDGDDGHTTFFDYWGMPEFAKWVNQHAYDGAELSTGQTQLRNFFSGLLHLCQDESIRASGYWSLKYFNNSDDLYSFARFEPGTGRLLVIAANFRPSSSVAGQVRIPAELANAANLAQNVNVRWVLDQRGARNELLGAFSSNRLTAAGFPVSLGNQEAQAFVIES